MPPKKAEVSRVRTGYEKVIAHRCSLPFAYSAKDDGKIVDYSEKAKLFKVKYKNGETDIVSFGEQYSNNAGLYITQKIECNVKKNQTVKKDDILCYNSSFFSKDYENPRNVSFNHGHFTNVLFYESNDTVEDSSCMTEELANDLGMEPVHERTISITKSTTIHSHVNVGDDVLATDSLMIIEEDSFDESDEGSSLSEKGMDLLSEMTRSAPRAKEGGSIANIKVFYGCPLSEMTPSLQKFVRKMVSPVNERNKFAKGTKQEMFFPKSNPLPKGSKLSGGFIDDETIIVKFYIKSPINLSGGDKVSVDSSLKSTTKRILPKPLVAEDGTVIDMVFAGTSVQNRIILSPVIVGTLETLLVNAEKRLIGAYFDDKKELLKRDGTKLKE